MTTPPVRARERHRLLTELLRLTPDPASDPVDLASLERCVEDRQRLLVDLPPPDRDPVAPLQAECRALLEELQRRDVALLARLGEVRAHIARLLRRSGGDGSTPGRLVQRTF